MPGLMYVTREETKIQLHFLTAHVCAANWNNCLAWPSQGSKRAVPPPRLEHGSPALDDRGSSAEMS
ncbi:hypothetical protein WG66_010578 [Moniliophthora roreri]|nr:hypothetical protein WG66_010578 [Moniliophthora roreri]